MQQMMNRRDFLIKQIKSALYFGAGMAGLYLPKSVIANSPSKPLLKIPHIGIVKGDPAQRPVRMWGCWAEWHLL